MNLAFEGFVTTAIKFPDCVGNRSTQEEYRLAGIQRTVEERETQVLVRGHLRKCSEEGMLVLSVVSVLWWYSSHMSLFHPLED